MTRLQCLNLPASNVSVSRLTGTIAPAPSRVLGLDNKLNGFLTRITKLRVLSHAVCFAQRHGGNGVFVHVLSAEVACWPLQLQEVINAVGNVLDVLDHLLLVELSAPLVGITGGQEW